MEIHRRKNASNSPERFNCSGSSKEVAAEIRLNPGTLTSELRGKINCRFALLSRSAQRASDTHDFRLTTSGGETPPRPGNTLCNGKTLRPHLLRCSVVP